MDVITTDAYIILFEKDVIKIIAIDDEAKSANKPSTENRDVTIANKIPEKDVTIENKEEPDQEVPGKNRFISSRLYAAP